MSSHAHPHHADHGHAHGASHAHGPSHTYGPSHAHGPSHTHVPGKGTPISRVRGALFLIAGFMLIELA
ncbi:MAG: hypothetical protein ACKOBM_13265, partial [Gammaproteobacteria bacterium]